MQELNRQLDIQLTAYVVGGLEDSERAEVEALLGTNARARSRLDELRLIVAPLAADKDSPSPPPGLALRTITLIAENWCRDLPSAPEPAKSSTGHTASVRWRRIDILVAACILLTVLGLVAPTIYRMQGGATRIDCQNNLREFAVALESYQNTKGSFPNIADYRPRDFAGMVIPILIDAGTLSAKANVRCPGIGPPMTCTLSLKGATDMADQELHCRAPLFTPCYAYSLGYQDDDEIYHAPGVCEGQAAAAVPIMSDGPPLGTRLLNSPNHGGEGQNILFIDGSVRFHTTRLIGNDDIFLNQAGLVGAGMGCLDIVLGNSSARP